MEERIQGLIAQLKAARIKKGLSQRALSQKTGIPQSHLSHIEQGHVDLQVSSLIELARVLDLEPVLVPRQYISAVQAMLSQNQSKQIPAYRLQEEP